MQKKSVIVLVSGGLDSVTALYDSMMEYDVRLALSFDYGAKHHHRELPLAGEHAHKLGVSHIIAPLDFIGEFFTSALLKNGEDVPDGRYHDAVMKQTVVPFRNGIMLAIAAGMAESRDISGIVIAAHKGDHAGYPDCRETFMASMGVAIEAGTYTGVELLRPFTGMIKGEIVARGAALGVDFSKTWSCYKGGNYHCGTCGTCIERREAFRIAGMSDPVIYQI